MTRVLIVDDSRTMRRVQREILSQLDIVTVFEAEDGVAAVHALREASFRIDLILVDWMMPRMDGLTFVELIKTHETLRRIPVLMVTSISDESKMGRALAAGVDGYLLKPFTKELLVRALGSLFPEAAIDTETRMAGDDGSAPGGFLDLLPADMRRRILDMSVVVRLAAGAEILRAGAAVEHFFFVIEGEVEESTQRHVAIRHSVGDCFAVTELIAGDPLGASFRAHSDVVLGRLAKAAFEGMLAKYPQIGVTLSRALAEQARASQPGSADGRGQELSASSETLDLPALVQAIGLRQKTCVLECPAMSAEIGFEGGRITAARYRGLEGPEAFFAIFREDLPSFRLVARAPGGDRNIFASSTRLLLECARRIDEEHAMVLERSRTTEGAAPLVDGSTAPDLLGQHVAGGFPAAPRHERSITK